MTGHPKEELDFLTKLNFVEEIILDEMSEYPQLDQRSENTTDVSFGIVGSP